MQQYSMVRNVDQGLKQVKEASSNKGYEAESKAFWHISFQKQVARAKNNVRTFELLRNVNLLTDHSGVGCMDELFPTRCMVSPNEVEETRVWTGYSNISSKHYLFQ